MPDLEDKTHTQSASRQRINISRPSTHITLVHSSSSCKCHVCLKYRTSEEEHTMIKEPTVGKNENK